MNVFKRGLTAVSQGPCPAENKAGCLPSTSTAEAKHNTFGDDECYLEVLK